MTAFAFMRFFMTGIQAGALHTALLDREGFRFLVPEVEFERQHGGADGGEDEGEQGTHGQCGELLVI